MLSEQDVKDLFERAKSEIKLCCDEAHAHEIGFRCFIPKAGEGPSSILVAMLCEHILTLKAKLRKVLDE